MLTITFLDAKKIRTAGKSHISRIQSQLFRVILTAKSDADFTVSSIWPTIIIRLLLANNSTFVDTKMIRLFVLSCIYVFIIRVLLYVMKSMLQLLHHFMTVTSSFCFDIHTCVCVCLCLRATKMLRHLFFEKRVLNQSAVHKNQQINMNTLS